MEVINEKILENRADKRNKKIDLPSYLSSYIELLKNIKENIGAFNCSEECHTAKFLNTYKSFEPYEKKNPLFIENLSHFFKEICSIKSKKEYFWGYFGNPFTQEIIGSVVLGSRRENLIKNIYIVLDCEKIFFTDDYVLGSEVFNEFSFIKKGAYLFYKNFLRNLIYSIIYKIYNNDVYFKNIIIIGSGKGGGLAQLISADLVDNFHIFKKHLGDSINDVKITCFITGSEPIGNQYFYDNFCDKKSLISIKECLLFTFLVEGAEGWNDIQLVGNSSAFI